MTPLSGAHIHITGVVQGVGFRPFVYGLAQRLHLAGQVRNTSAGVDIEVDGPREALAAFARALREEAPALARIDSLEVTERAPNGFAGFTIVASAPVPGAFQPISPDVSLCDDCRRELFDPADRRYRYPFINCTNCGPRFTIIRDIPYDRPQTTMAGFPLCDACAAEYHDPADRRFHAEPVACPVCGPKVWIEGGQGAGMPDDPLQQARALLQNGAILAVKGLGGFHLACDATSEEAVAELRRRKLRVDKPFAVMMAGIATVERHCEVSEGERALLLSRERPVVILQRRPESTIAPAVAPNQTTIGVMLPYTPLHELLLEPAPGFPEALVMTSGNLSEEPIAYTNEDARERLARLADAFLMHDRDIYVRCDDSVVRELESGAPVFLRRSRGYAPGSLPLPWDVPPLLATGAELKNTFCLARDRYAFLSHHIGDLENYETLRSFEDSIAHFERLFHVTPQALAYDLHPNYLATRYALERAQREGLPAIGVQHHHAHIAACMAEHGLPGDEPIIGVSFDGTGYGLDETTGAPAIWGGEFLIAGYGGFRRAAHLAYIPLPGGDRAVKEPWRIALAWLQAADAGWDATLPPVAYGASLAPYALDALAHQLQSGVNAPPTSSMGRLFDAVAALAGVRQTVNYEAQAAVELEALVDPQESGSYPFALNGSIVDPVPAIAAVAEDVRAGTSLPVIAARFHNGVAQMVAAVCCDLRERSGLNAVALSGGVWQNMTLLRRTLPLLAACGFTVYVHRRVPANDGGLALGQAAILGWHLNNKEKR